MHMIGRYVGSDHLPAFTVTYTQKGTKSTIILFVLMGPIKQNKRILEFYTKSN